MCSMDFWTQFTSGGVKESSTSISLISHFILSQVLLHERDNEHPNLLKLLFMLIGFVNPDSLIFVQSDALFHRPSSEI